MIKNNPSEFSFFVADANYILKTGKVFPERIGSAKINLHSKRIIQTLNTLYKHKAITKQEYDKVMEAYRVTVTKQ